MAKMVEMTFAIGATMTSGFAGAFGKAGQAISELQKQSSNLQKASSQIGTYQKMQGSMAQTAIKLNTARMRVKELAQQMRSTNVPTDALKKQFTAANVEANRLQISLGNQRKKLGDLRTELTAAGINTKNLASNQSQLSETARKATSEEARLAAQSQKLADTQTRLQNAQARLAATRQRLSWNNIKGDVMSSAAMAYSLYKPVSQASDFESAMARVNAVAFSGGNNRTAEQKAANAESLKALEEQARELGRATQYTAVQAAQTQENLARAGFNSNEIISAMPGLLSMAAAEGMDLANAADIAASTLRGFNLSADQTNRVADVLAQTSAASNTSIAALGDSMKYVAPVASGLGISVEEVSAMLGVMANAGIKGSQGGTALRAALNRLSKEPKAVEKALGELGIKSRDVNGNMRDMTELLTALQGRLKNMGSADQMQYLSNIFGSEAAAGMLAVMNGAVDGTLGQLKLLNYESNGILNEISSHIKVPIEELRAGMENALPAAQHLGISYKDLSVYLGLLAKGGKQGVEVDKALTIAFDRLAQKPEEVQKALKQFNISAFDDKGKLRDMPVLMKEISDAIMGIEQGKRLNILEQIFGKNSGDTMQVLMKGFAAGAEKELIEVANKAKGVSAEMMEKQLATLSGQWAIATSAMQDFMIEVGIVLLPYVTAGVKAFGWLTSKVTGLMQAFPRWTKGIVTCLGAIAAFKIAKTIYSIGGALLTLPGTMINVIKATREAKGAVVDIGTAIAESSKKSGLFSKIFTGLSNGAKGIGKAFVSVGKGIGEMFRNLVSISVKSGEVIWNITKMSLFHAKQIVITAATKTWAAAQGLLNLAIKTGKGLLDVAKLALYYGKQILITTATKAWTAAQWLWNAALNANPIGLMVTAIAGAITIGYTLYKNWDDIKALGSSMWIKIQSAAQKFINWWNSDWKLLDIFSPLLTKCSEAINYLKGKWQDFKSWIKGIFTPDTFDYMITPEFMAEAKVVGSPAYHINAMNSAFAIPEIGPVTQEIAVQQKIIAENDVSDEVKKVAAEAAYIEKELQKQTQNITVLNSMSEGFSQRVAEMTAAWQPFKNSLGAGFEQIYSVMQGVADKIRGVTIPAVNELASALGSIAGEINSIVQAGELSVKVATPRARAMSSVPAQYQRMAGFAHAEGGIFSQPHIGIVAEAGSEAIIPLKNQARGMQLWLEAGHELGLLKNAEQSSATMNALKIQNDISSMLAPRNMLSKIWNSIFPQQNLEERTRGLPLWKLADEKIGFKFGGNTTNNTNLPAFQPVINITVNGEDPSIAERFQQMVLPLVKDKFDEFMDMYLNNVQRVAFAE